MHHSGSRCRYIDICEFKSFLSTHSYMLSQKQTTSWAVVVHAFNPSTWEAEASGFEFEASLVYKVSSRTARATQRNCLEKKRERKRERERKKL